MQRSFLNLLSIQTLKHRALRARLTWINLHPSSRRNHLSSWLIRGLPQKRSLLWRLLQEHVRCQVDLLPLRVENRHLFRLVTAGKYHYICISQQLPLFFDRVCSQETSVRLQAFLDSHPQLFGVSTDASEWIDNSSLAQVQFRIITLVHFLRCLLDIAEVNFDLFPVDNGHVVLAVQDWPGHCSRFLLWRLAGTTH